MMNQKENGRERVILLHALAGTKASMLYLEYRLRKAGFETCNMGYPSTRKPIEELASHVAARLPKSEKPLHYVTHSMGGIVLRQMIRENRPPNLGRVVMFAPPNQGSCLAARLRRNWYFRTVFGPAGQQLIDGAGSLPRKLGPVDFELGIIAGTFPIGRLVKDPSDGRVMVEETKVEGMTDFVEVSASHTFIIFNRQAIRQAIHFLRYARFDHK